MNPIISIIVPIYNAEKYLHQCIDSLLSQGLKSEEYEIILVNDGSTDKSLSICEHYKSLNSNITIINQSNAGVSAARNQGINHAIGEYICFVDADDYLVPNGLSYLLSHYDYKQCDILRYWSTILYNEKDRNQDCTGEELFRGTGWEFIENNGLETFCICYLYNNNFIKRNKIQFAPYTIGEDFLFISSVLLTNSSIISTSSNIYRYVIHPQSATTTRSTTHSRKCVNDHLAVNKEIIIRTKNNNLIKHRTKLYQSINNTLQNKMLLIFSRILSAKYSKSEYQSIIQECVNYHLLPITLSTDSIKYKLFYQLINTLMHSFILYRINCYFYNNLFIPYILPKLNRN